jgi:hypothetical protein
MLNLTLIIFHILFAVTMPIALLITIPLHIIVSVISGKSKAQSKAENAQLAELQAIRKALQANGTLPPEEAAAGTQQGSSAAYDVGQGLAWLSRQNVFWYAVAGGIVVASVVAALNVSG